MRINIKEKSLDLFFGVTEAEKRTRETRIPAEDFIIPKRADVSVDDAVVFEFDDTTYRIKSELLVTLTFRVYEYDSLSYQLKLESKSVSFKN